MDVGILLLRLAVGLTVGAHGLQKLTTHLGGNGVAGTSRFVESLGFRPGRFFAYLLGVAELTGGFFIAAGLLTPVGALAVIGVMTAAVVTVHRRNGFFVTDGGFEYPVILGMAAAAIAIVGPGSFSLDALLDTTVSGTLPAIGVVLLGVLSGLVASAIPQLSQRLQSRGTQMHAN
jgi:putative oxidoreductase